MEIPENPLSWVEIDRRSIQHNIRAFRRFLPHSVFICAVIKANGYGHDMVETARILSREDIWGFGVADLNEALNLRHHGIRKPIFVMTYYSTNQLVEAVKQGIELPVYTTRQVQLLNAIGKKLRRHVNVHVKIDVGTSRIGIQEKDSRGFFIKVSRQPYLQIRGIFSHLADSESASTTYTNKQLATFTQILRKTQVKSILCHIACTAASLRYPSSHNNMVRLGIGLYGYWPSPDTFYALQKSHPSFRLRRAFSWHARLLQVKTVPRGVYVGYGRSWRAKRKTRVGIVPVGYWDGFPRSLSNKGQMIVRGVRCAVIGRICMNCCMIDCSRVPNVKEGDRVTLCGTNGHQEITADEIAHNAETIAYEILARIHPRIPRRVT